jgi:uncharacterized membrane protein
MFALRVDAFEPNSGRAGIDGHDKLLAAFEEEEEPIRVFALVVADGDGIDARPLQVIQQVLRTDADLRDHVVVNAI